jgi:hypothetical protein
VQSVAGGEISDPLDMDETSPLPSGQLSESALNDVALLGGAVEARTSFCGGMMQRGHEEMPLVETEVGG